MTARNALAVVLAGAIVAVLAGCGLFARATPEEADVVGEWRVQGGSLAEDWPGAWVRLDEDGRYEGELPGPLVADEVTAPTLLHVQGEWELERTVMGHWEVAFWPDRDDAHRFGGIRLIVSGTVRDPALEWWIDQDKAEFMRFERAG